MIGIEATQNNPAKCELPWSLIVLPEPAEFNLSGVTTVDEISKFSLVVQDFVNQSIEEKTFHPAGSSIEPLQGDIVAAEITDKVFDLLCVEEVDPITHKITVSPLREFSCPCSIEGEKCRVIGHISVAS